MKKSLIYATLILLATGCAVEPHKKPLQPEALAQLPQPTTYVRIDPRGVGVEYFYQQTDASAATAQFGLVGALVGALVVAGVDAAMNAGPLKVAEIGAEQMASAFQLDKVRSEFRGHLDERLKSAPPFNQPMQVVFMEPEQKVEASAFPDPAVFTVEFASALSQDLRYLHVSADVKIFDKSKIAPTKDKKKTTRTTAADTKQLGLIYRNHFDYFSSRLDPAPEKTKADIDAAVAAAREKYPQKRLTDSQRIKLQKEIDAAKKPATPLVKAEYLVKLWLANDAALLNEKLAEGAGEVAKLVARDLGDPLAFDTKAKLPPKSVIEEANGRVIVRYNTIPVQGVLGSEPANFVRTPSNGVMYTKPPKKDTVAAAETNNKK